MKMQQRPWLVLRIKPLQYVRAAVSVRNQDSEFYCPRALIRSDRARALREQPLFPGYAFARPVGERWAFLRSTVGVLDVLMASGENPAWVPDREIARLRSHEGPDGLIRLEAAAFARGETVQLDDGPMAGLLAVVDGMSGRDRIFVLFEFLGQITRAEVAVRSVSRA